MKALAEFIYTIMVAALIFILLPSLVANSKESQLRTCKDVKSVFVGKLRERTSTETNERARLRGYLHGVLERLHGEKKIGDTGYTTLLRDLDPQLYIEFCEAHPDATAERWLIESAVKS
jgi:hypothetical protein